jgi:hypothetical protein
VRALIAALILSSPAQAAGEDLGVLERLKALQNKQIQSADPYADEVAADLERIEELADFLFGSDRSGQIVLFTQTSCEACDTALSEFEALIQDLNINARMYQADDPRAREALDLLGLDLLPSYVMPDRMIRGHVPQFVLRRYLSEE